MIVKIVSHNSPDYSRALSLRHHYLRAPLGLDFTAAEMEMDREAIHFLAFSGEDIIGCVIGQPQSDSLKIRQMVVAETMRKQGVGKQLMEALEAYFIKAGACRFTMHARIDAVRFYEKLGYRKIGELFTEIGIPHQRLDKVLLPAN